MNKQLFIAKQIKYASLSSPPRITDLGYLDTRLRAEEVILEHKKKTNLDYMSEASYEYKISVVTRGG